MSLRLRALIILVVAFVTFMAYGVVVSRFVLLRTFEWVEEQDALENARRAANALTNDVAALDATTEDWASWDETYAFVIGQNETFVSTNLSGSTFKYLRLNAVLLLDTSGRVVLAKGFDLDRQAEEPVSTALLDRIAQQKELLLPNLPESNASGFIYLSEGPMLVASRPVLTSLGLGPIRGALVMGRYLDGAESDLLGNITRLNLAIHPLGDPGLPTELKQPLYFTGPSDALVLAVPLNGDVLGGYAVVRDIGGKPALVIEAKIPRRIYRTAVSSVSTFALSFLLVGPLMCLVGVVLLDRGVLSRLRGLRSSVRRVESTGDLSARVAVQGNDEVADLGGAIDGMLGKLQRVADERRVIDEELLHQLLLTQERERRLRTMALGLAALSSAPPSEVIARLLQVVTEATGVTAASFFRYEEGRGRLRWDSSTDETSSLQNQGRGTLDFPLGQEQGLVGIVAASAQPFYVSNTKAEPRWIAQREDFLSAYLVPVSFGGHLYGVLQLVSQTSDGVSPEQRSLSDTLGASAGAILENARLLGQERLRAQEMETLFTVSNALAAPGTFEEKTVKALEVLAEVFEAWEVTLRLPDDKTGMLRRVATAGPAAEAPPPAYLPLDQDSLEGKAMRQAEPAISQDSDADLRVLVGRGAHSVAALSIRAEGKSLGVLVIACLEPHRFTERGIRLLTAVADGLGPLLESARLTEQVRILAVEEERERISQDMHDGLAQVLGYVNIQAQAVDAYLGNGDVGKAHEEILKLSTAARSAYQEVRRDILALRSPAAAGPRLEDSLEQYLVEYQSQAPFPVRLHWRLPPGDVALDPAQEVQVLRILQEALANVRKHAAPTLATVTLSALDGTFEMEVADDGRGFDPLDLPRRGWPHLGLQIMRERAEAIGGDLEIDSARERGTVIRLRVPLAVRVSTKEGTP